MPAEFVIGEGLSASDQTAWVRPDDTCRAPVARRADHALAAPQLLEVPRRFLHAAGVATDAALALRHSSTICGRALYRPRCVVGVNSELNCVYFTCFWPICPGIEARSGPKHVGYRSTFIGLANKTRNNGNGRSVFRARVQSMSTNPQ